MALIHPAPPPPEPPAGPLTSHRALDLVFIEGLTGDTVIGIHESELHQTQPVVIDVVAGLPRARACDTDSITDTLDYGVLRERLHRLLREHRVRLLEAFAEAVCGVVLHEFGAAWVRVKVAKPRKFDDVAAVGVQIERHAAPPEHAPGATVLQLIGSAGPSHGGA